MSNALLHENAFAILDKAASLFPDQLCVSVIYSPTDVQCQRSQVVLLSHRLRYKIDGLSSALPAGGDQSASKRRCKQDSSQGLLTI